MVRRMSIFGLIFTILVFQKNVTFASETSSTTEEVSTPNSTLPEFPSSVNREVPAVFPSNGSGGKPIISLNETVDKPNLSDIEINLNRNNVTVNKITNSTEEHVNATVKTDKTIESNISTSTSYPYEEHVNATVRTDKTTEDNISTSTPYQVNSTQAANSDTDAHLSTTEVPYQIISGNSSKPVDTEVSDLLEVPKKNYDLVPVLPNITYKQDQDVNLSVMLFDNVLKTEDSLRNHSDHQTENVGVIQGKLAAILAGVFLVVSIFGYVSLLSWRRFLEHRYGNREMLVNEEDFYTEDLGHFSI